MPWQCVTCCELIDEPFDACWNCGTWRSGERNRTFRRADRIRPESLTQGEHERISLPPARFQFSLRTLLVLMTFFALACMVGSIWWELAWFIAIWSMVTIVAMLLMKVAIDLVYDLVDSIRSRRK